VATIPQRFRLALLLLMPGFALADTAAMATYLSAKPLRMEVRYCECAVMAADGRSLLPLASFMEAADALSVAVDINDKGFIASGPLSFGYAIHAEPGQPDTFHFQYAGDFTSQKGQNMAQGTLLLEKDQWLSLFGAQGGDTETGVAIRITDATGP